MEKATGSLFHLGIRAEVEQMAMRNTAKSVVAAAVAASVEEVRKNAEKQTHAHLHPEAPSGK